jgi:hypothetical protein
VTLIALVTGAALLAAAALVVVTLAVHHTLRRVLKVLNPAWLWFTGLPLDGVSRTNATWTMRSHGPRPVLHPSGNAVWWHHLHRWHRTGIRTGASLAFAGALYGLVAATEVTVVLFAVLATAGLLVLAWHVFYVLRNWRHERHYVRPLERTLTRKLPAAPLSLEVEREGDAVRRVAIEWPPDTEIGSEDQQKVLQSVTARLAIEAPDASWKLRGRDRSVVFTQSEPPPSRVCWEDVAQALRSLGHDELLFGLGKRNAITKAAYSDSPHIAIPGGSGGGKSNLAAFLLIQEMLRGSLIFNLDPKWISHLWLQDLPNVINAHDIPELHLALTWLGKELLRRTKTAYYSAEGTGRVRGNVGPRIIVLCEELNYGMPGLKRYWAENREKGQPKQSPAIAGLSALSCAGRASDIHEWLIAQLLTVESTGVKDSTIRTNAGIKGMVRWDPGGWAMAVGKHIPMPAQTTIPGRIQLVTRNGPREAQVPYLHLDDADEDAADKAVKWARELVVSGVVATIPGGPEGIPPQLWPASVLRQEHLALIPAQGTGTARTSGTETNAPVMVSLRQAVAEETLRFAGRDPLGAARKASQRPGFPEVAGWDGKTALYYRAELAEWQNGKVRAVR